MSRETQPLAHRFLELDRIGLWQTDAGERGSAALLSRTETLLPAAKPGSRVKAADSAYMFSWLHGDLVPLLLAAVLLLLLAESWLCHRHAVY